MINKPDLRPDMLIINEQIDWIRRGQIETEKFIVQQRKLMAQAIKLERCYPFRPGRYVATGVSIGIALMVAGALVARFACNLVLR